MEELLHQLRLVVYPIIYSVLLFYTVSKPWLVVWDSCFLKENTGGLHRPNPAPIAQPCFVRNSELKAIASYEQMEDEAHSQGDSEPVIFVQWGHIGVSKNNGTPKSSILIGFSIINHPFWGTPNFWKPPCGDIWVSAPAPCKNIWFESRNGPLRNRRESGKVTLQAYLWWVWCSTMRFTNAGYFTNSRCSMYINVWYAYLHLP